MDPASFIAVFALESDSKPNLPPPSPPVTLIQQKILEGIQFKPPVLNKDEKTPQGCKPIQHPDDVHQDMDQPHAPPSQLLKVGDEQVGKTKEKPGEHSGVLARSHSSAPVPTLWKLADRYGTTWFHTNKNYLEWWVAQRNVPPRIQFSYSAPVYSPCSGGTCYR